MTERSGSDKVQNGMGAPVAARSLLSRWKDVRGAAEVDGSAEVVGCAEDLASPAARSVEIG